VSNLVPRRELWILNVISRVDALLPLMGSSNWVSNRRETVGADGSRLSDMMGNRKHRKAYRQRQRD